MLEVFRACTSPFYVLLYSREKPSEHVERRVLVEGRNLHHQRKEVYALRTEGRVLRRVQLVETVQRGLEECVNLGGDLRSIPQIDHYSYSLYGRQVPAQRDPMTAQNGTS